MIPSQIEIDVRLQTPCRVIDIRYGNIGTQCRVIDIRYGNIKLGRIVVSGQLARYVDLHILVCPDLDLSPDLAY